MPSSVLIVKPSSLGDIVHTLPAVTLIKRAWPQARLRWVVNPEWAPLLEGNPDIDELILFPRRGSPGLAGVRRQIQWLLNLRASCQSDLILDFQGLLRSAIIGRACRRSAGGVFVGLSDSREGARFFYDRVASVSRSSDHAVERYLKLAAAVGVDTTGPLEWKLPMGNRPAGFSLKEPFILFHPFSRGAGKSLSVEDVNAFCETLPLPVVLVGRTGERIAPPANVLDLLNQTSIVELIWLIRHARFIVSVDSGPMHIAAALTPNLLSIHMWSDPALVGPYCPQAWVWKDRTLFQAGQIGDSVAKRLSSPDLQAIAAFVAQRASGSP